MDIWYGLDGQPIDIATANALLGDELARRIAHTTLITDRGRITVSTVFLVLDHNHWRGGPPVLWETMVFDGPVDQEQRRYQSLEAAEAGHVEMVDWVKATVDLAGATVLAEETFDRECR